MVKSYKGIKGVVIGVIILGAVIGGFYLFYNFVLPAINQNNRDQNNSYSVEWEGYITDKHYEISGDHEIYFLEINGTSNESLSTNLQAYNRFPIGEYVYYINLGNGFFVLTDDVSLYII